MAESRKHRKSEFGEWKKALRVELGVRKTGMRTNSGDVLGVWRNLGLRNQE